MISKRGVQRKPGAKTDRQTKTKREQNVPKIINDSNKDAKQDKQENSL